jgi:hypothetical protein
MFTNNQNNQINLSEEDIAMYREIRKEKLKKAAKNVLFAALAAGAGIGVYKLVKSREDEKAAATADGDVGTTDSDVEEFVAAATNISTDAMWG